MEALKFKEDSWHKFVADVGGFRRRSRQDLCSYLSHFLIGLIMLTVMGTVLTLFSTFMLWVFGNLLMCLAYSLYYGQWMWNEAGKAGAFFSVILIAATVLFTIPLWLEWIIKKIRSVRVQRHVFVTKPVYDNFIVNAYNSVKGKYCIPIKFEE